MTAMPDRPVRAATWEGPSALRPPDQLMRLSRLGAAHPTRLSVMRVLLRGLQAGDWRADRPLWEIDRTGVGRAVYRVRGEGQTYSLVAFAHDLPDHLRSDRVIAEAWDATFALVDGAPTEADLDRLAANVPKQEAGRVTDRELVLSRANRSGRLWEHVVARLAEGHQPDPTRLDAVGYLMRTTAVYGSGKFGAADHAALRGRPLMDGPFRAEMLAVWLIRAFVADLAEHMARARGGVRAVPLAPELRRRLGLGNATGLGMAPFLVNHPDFLHAWIAARETGFARVRDRAKATRDTARDFADALRAMRAALPLWRTEDPVQRAACAELAADLDRLAAHVAAGALSGRRPWEALWPWAQGALGLEGQEVAVALMLDAHRPVVDDLAEAMGADELVRFRIDGAMPVARLAEALRAGFGWAIAIDFDALGATASRTCPRPRPSRGWVRTRRSPGPSGSSRSALRGPPWRWRGIWSDQVRKPRARYWPSIPYTDVWFGEFRHWNQRLTGRSATIFWPGRSAQSTCCAAS